MIELVAGGLGWLFLHMFFRAVETQWPHSYYSLGDVTAYRISASPVSYFLFRFLPVVAVCFFVSTALLSAGRSGFVAVAVIVSLHLAFTHIRAMTRLLGASGAARFSRASLLASHLIAAVLVVFAGLMGLAAARSATLRELVPSASELAASLWTAAFAGVVGAYLVKLSQAREPDMEELIGRSRSTIDDRLWEVARSSAVAENADVDLVLAILLIENLQRPRWVRALERLKGLAIPSGSYGVMQVNSPRPLSDEESIREAIRSRLSNAQVTGSDDDVDYEALARVIRAYNGDERFGNLVTHAYFQRPSSR